MQIVEPPIRARSILAALALASLALLVAAPRAAQAQWWDNVPQKIPLNAKGEPDLTEHDAPPMPRRARHPRMVRREPPGESPGPKPVPVRR